MVILNDKSKLLGSEPESCIIILSSSLADKFILSAIGDWHELLSPLQSPHSSNSADPKQTPKQSKSSFSPLQIPQSSTFKSEIVSL